MRAGVVALVAVLLMMVGLPLWALLAKGFEDARRPFRRPRQLRRLFLDPGAVQFGAQQLPGRGRQHPGRGAARLPLRLCADPHRAAAALAVPGHRADPDLRALAAAGPGADLPVRHAGLLQGLAGRRPDLRLQGHRHRPGLLLFPARHADPGDGAAHRRRAALRGGRCAGRLEDPRVLHRHPAGRQVRRDQRGAWWCSPW